MASYSVSAFEFRRRNGDVVYDEDITHAGNAGISAGDYI